MFVFLALTSVVAIWRDVDNSQLTLATGWNVTNTLILGVFMVVALRESWRNNHPAPTRALRDTTPAPGWTLPDAPAEPALQADGPLFPAPATPATPGVLVGAGSQTRNLA